MAAVRMTNRELGRLSGRLHSSRKKKNAPDLQGMLWGQMLEAGLARYFVREYRFAPAGPTWTRKRPASKLEHWRWRRTDKARKWRFDFCAPQLRIAVEIEGASFSGGRHTRGATFAQDASKANETALAGFLLLRADTTMVQEGVALDFIRRAIAAREGRRLSQMDASA